MITVDPAGFHLLEHTWDIEAGLFRHALSLPQIPLEEYHNFRNHLTQ
jgi:hypothetical protein